MFQLLEQKGNCLVMINYLASKASKNSVEITITNSHCSNGRKPLWPQTIDLSLLLRRYSGSTVTMAEAAHRYCGL
jgi:hypothetical protein